MFVTIDWLIQNQTTKIEKFEVTIKLYIYATRKIKNDIKLVNDTQETVYFIYSHSYTRH